MGVGGGWRGVHELEILHLGVNVVADDDDKQQRPINHVDREQQVKTLPARRERMCS